VWMSTIHRNEHGDRAVHAAASHGHVACLRLLIEARADLGNPIMMVTQLFIGLREMIGQTALRC
jgi:ankyrin repeat protein